MHLPVSLTGEPNDTNCVFMTSQPKISRQQRAFNIYARLVQKPTLRYTRPVKLLRWVSNLSAPLTYKRPAGLLLRNRTLQSNGAQVPVTDCWIKHQDFTGTLLYLHGGGFVIGGLPIYQHLIGTLGQAAGIRGVYLDYRMAPEHPFPAALDDAVTAYQALLADPDAGPIALAGDSAGGNLVFALMLKAKALGLPMPFAAATFSPAVDLSQQNPSFAANAKSDHILPTDWAARSARSYVGNQSPDDPLLSPIKGDFTGAPPVLIHSDSTEALADDARLMAAHLIAQGVDTTTEVATGRTHVWHLNVGRTPEADASVAATAAFFRRHLPA